MTQVMSLRLDPETSQHLDELAAEQPSRTAAVVAAINQAWQHLQEQKLEVAYAAAVADNPHYPYESSQERAALRQRRDARAVRE